MDYSLKKRTRRSSEDKMQKEYRVPLIICCFIFSIYALSLLYPMFWILVKSFGDPLDFTFDAERFFPLTITLENYTVIFSGTISNFKFVSMIINTVVLSIVTPTLQIAACCCISYAFAKFRFRGRGIVYFCAIASMFIPSVGTLAITYKLMRTLGLMDTIPGYIILCSSGMGFSFLLVGSQYENVSKEYSEAAEIDGASRFRVFVQVVTPLILPTITALWVLAFIGCWNDYQTPYLFLPNNPTLSVGIKKLQYYAVQNNGYPVLFAGIIMVEIPVIAVFFAFQKKILSFSLGGGIKG